MAYQEILKALLYNSDLKLIENNKFNTNNALLLAKQIVKNVIDRLQYR